MIVVLMKVSLWAKMTSRFHFRKHEDQKKGKDSGLCVTFRDVHYNAQQTNDPRSGGND